MGSGCQNRDQISSNWHDLRLKYTEFGKIYNNTTNLYKIRSNNFDVLSVAMEQYEKTTTHKYFSYMKLWLKLKDALKMDTYDAKDFFRFKAFEKYRCKFTTMGRSITH